MSRTEIELDGAKTFSAVVGMTFFLTIAGIGGIVLYSGFTGGSYPTWMVLVLATHALVQGVTLVTQTGKLMMRGGN